MSEIYLQPLYCPETTKEKCVGNIAVDSFPYTIGRHRDCDLRLSDCSTSRRHCRLFLRKGQVWVEDLGSLNGTYVNEAPIKAPRPLQNGDLLRLAFVLFKVHDPAPATEETEVDAAGGGRHVLVVEDDANAAESLALLLKAWGHEVRVAHDGPEALQAARDYPPDTVFLDVRLPGMDGFQVAQRLREEPGLENAQLVAMTGCCEETAGRRSEDSGVQRVLIKPVAPETLRDVLCGVN